MHRATTSPYLFSGLLKCSSCGGNLVIVGGRGSKWARYGCTQRWNRGASKNSLTIPRNAVEGTVLAELQNYSQRPEAIDLAVSEFMLKVEKALGDENPWERLLRRKSDLEAEVERLTSALAQGAPIASVKNGLRSRESELKEVSKKLLQTKSSAPGLEREKLMQFARERLTNVLNLLRVNAENSKYELAKHIGVLWMTPVKDANGKPYYIGVGQWDLLGFLPDGFAPSLCVPNWVEKGPSTFVKNYYIDITDKVIRFERCLRAIGKWAILKC